MFPKMLQDALPGMFPAPGTAAGLTAEFCRPMLAAMAGAGNLMTAGAAAMNLEWTRFISMRLAKDAALMRYAASCRTPQCLMNAANEYWQTAIADYQAEWQQLAQVSGRTACGLLDVYSKSLASPPLPKEMPAPFRNGALDAMTRH